MWDYSKCEQFRYGGDDVTYRKASDFLGDCAVEDWGCGTAWARQFFKNYKGVDWAPGFADIVADLRTHKTQTDGILLRHVLEHNYDWEKILQNALQSSKKLCLIIFTPFQETTREIVFNHGVDVPDIGFKKEDLTRFFPNWTEETLQTATQYNTETIFYINTDGITN